jgi:hypothetical protein
MLECREALFRWGFKLPPRENVHTFVRLRFDYAADADLKNLGRKLEKFCKLRNRADYDLSVSPTFASDTKAREAIQEVTAALVLLDAIDGDPVRQAAAIAAIQAAFP